MKKELTLASLFDGSGGFPQAAKINGIRPLWSSEIEPFPALVTYKRLPDVPNLGDVRTIRGAEVPPVDVITFGSPCQDLSSSGRRAGIIEGKRSSLFFEALRIIREMREATGGASPRFAIWENVPGALSSNGGNDFLEVLRSFVSLWGDNDENIKFDRYNGGGGGEVSVRQVSFEDAVPLLLGEFLTPNFSEYPSAGVACSLSAILEDDPPKNYYLTKERNRSELERYSRSGRPLPDSFRAEVRRLLQ